MDIEKEIKRVLFEMGKDIKIHKIDADNSVLEIDYDKYVIDLMKVFITYMSN